MAQLTTTKTSLNYVIERMEWSVSLGDSDQVVIIAPKEYMWNKGVRPRQLTVTEHRKFLVTRIFYEWDTSTDEIVIRNLNGYFMLKGSKKFGSRESWSPLTDLVVAQLPDSIHTFIRNDFNLRAIPKLQALMKNRLSTIADSKEV